MLEQIIIGVVVGLVVGIILAILLDAKLGRLFLRVFRPTLPKKRVMKKIGVKEPIKLPRG